MQDLIPFGFQDSVIRAVMIDGEPHLVAKDVAIALGYANHSDAIRRHCKGVVKRYPLMTTGGPQEARVINEADVMRLIVSSSLPAAEAFERKVFEDILPTIRKTGGYGKPSLDLTSLDSISALLDAGKAALNRAIEAESRVQELAPKAAFADAVATSHTSILVGDLAKILKGNGLDIGANRLFARLREEGYLIRRNGTDWNMPTQKSMELGLFEVKETVVKHADGHSTISKTPKVTGKGQTYFIQRYLSRDLSESEAN